MAESRISVNKACQVLGLETLDGLAPDLVRRQFLRHAVRVHPDKNPSSNAGELFAELKEAHDLLLAHITAQERVGIERETSDAVLDLLLKTLRGKILETELEGKLAALGVHRPPSDFGVVPGVRFDCRLPNQVDGQDASAEDILRHVFCEAGVPWNEKAVFSGDAERREDD